MFSHSGHALYSFKTRLVLIQYTICTHLRYNIYWWHDRYSFKTRHVLIHATKYAHSRHESHSRHDIYSFKTRHALIQDTICTHSRHDVYAFQTINVPIEDSICTHFRHDMYPLKTRYVTIEDKKLIQNTTCRHIEEVLKNLILIGLYYRSLFICRGLFHRSLLLRRMYSLLHSECHPISISHLNLPGLFSTEPGKRDLETRVSIEFEIQEMTLQMQ